jgi:hypothetical protein
MTRFRSILRGLAAVAALVATAADALVTALIGIPPVTWALRRVSRVIGEEYRRGYHGAIDAEVIEDTTTAPAIGPGHGPDGDGA